jgi:hypothetical protein
MTAAHHQTIVRRWREWSEGGLQHLELTLGDGEIAARAHVIGTEDGIRFAARYHILCDGDWRARRLDAEVLGGHPRIVLASDGAGHWRDGAGHPLPELEGAIDIDLPITPFTNTLPVRRLGLAAGRSADLRVAYVRLTAGSVTLDPQRYTCLEEGRRYHYESLDSDFEAEITVDEHGLVLDYPGLFRRAP